MRGLKNNSLRTVYHWFSACLEETYGKHESQSMARIIFEHALRFNAVDVMVKREVRLSESDIVMLYKTIQKLEKGVPVQHITGLEYFRSLVLRVNGDVLIPRPETEELVKWILDDFANVKPYRSLKIWDIGTGSGAIALSLVAEMNSTEVWASDVSEKALAVAKQNSDANGHQVRFFRHNILEDALPDRKFDVVVSNPPYIRHSEKPLMRNNVLDHEPHAALFVPDEDPLLFYRAIGQMGIKLLNPAGKVYLEINEAFGLETCQLYESMGYVQVEVRKDLPGKDRFVRASLPA